MSFDPNSTDAVFSRLIERLDQQDATLARIEAAVNKTNGRVTTLEKWRDVLTAKTAMIAGACATACGLGFEFLRVYLRE